MVQQGGKKAAFSFHPPHYPALLIVESGKARGPGRSVRVKAAALVLLFFPGLLYPLSLAGGGTRLPRCCICSPDARLASGAAPAHHAHEGCEGEDAKVRNRNSSHKLAPLQYIKSLKGTLTPRKHWVGMMYWNEPR